MRLTLRTLLAYLDNTLDPGDAEKLRDKLGESGFATQLVQRIRNMLDNRSIPAPSPEAVGPVEEANVISEYLDSTLPSEQVAEIERACLESDPHLAEAAACHQILTMVLGKPAEVSPELRQRIYELPDRKAEDVAVAGSFSSVNVPTEQPHLNPLADDLPTADVTSTRDGEPVKPVGVADSGVSDAPTRLREAGNDDSANVGIAGAKPRSLDRDSTFYGGSIRPSRITPWLVSLALAGVLLFALTRIFQPLFDQGTARNIADNGLDDPIEEVEVPADQSPLMVDVQGPTGEVASTENADDTETLPVPNPSNMSSVGEQNQATTTNKPREPESAETTAPSGSATPVAETRVTEKPVTEKPVAESNGAATPGAATPDKAAADVAASNKTAQVSPVPPPATAMAKDPGRPTPPPANAVVDPVIKEIAKITGKTTTLLAGLAGDQWVRLKKDMIVGEGLKILCAPTFRGQMGISNAEITIVGPAQVEWLLGDQDDVTLHVEFGRILVSATKADATLTVRLGDETVELKFADVATVAAASVKHFRAPGFDPLNPENRIPLAGVLSVQGTLQVVAAEKEQALQTGQQWIKRGSAASKVTPVESVPDWIDPPDPAEATLESSARNGLLELLTGDQPLEIALREATSFRRTEVGALAGQTLLNLGRSDVYFGGDGILSQPKQRAYWPDHYVTLLATVDRSAASAERLHASILSMDSANAKPMFRLLTGYSQKQLVEGGDEELVQLLDSSSMAVRVLALENLHKITGTTLYFRAEQENAIRRAPVIKKWVVRQRKGDIRWQE